MKVLILIVFAVATTLCTAQEILGSRIKTTAFISGENKVRFKMGSAVVQMYPAVENYLNGPTSGHTHNDFVDGSVLVSIQNGNGTGTALNIGEDITNPFGSGTVVGWTGDHNGPNVWVSDGYIDVYNITQYVKEYYPALIDQWGYFRIKSECRYDKNVNTIGYNIFEFELFVATDYHYELNRLTSCEGDQLNLDNGLTSSYWFQSPSTYQVEQTSCTSGSSLSGSNYNVGQIIPDAVDSCEVVYTASNSWSINQTIGSGEWFILGNIHNYDPANGGWQPIYSGSSLQSHQYNGWINKTVNCLDSNMVVVSNNANISLSSFPSPLYNNSAPIILENSITVSNEDNYSMVGPNVSWNNLGGYHNFNPSISQGSHPITVMADRGYCSTSETFNIIVQQWPGIPGSPILDWVASFDDSTENASFGGSGTPPCETIFIIGGGSYIECNYNRHKFLCPLRKVTGTDYDSLELFIDNPQLGFTYEWKLSIDGLEQNLGTGVSKKIARRINPQANGNGTYRETILIRAQNSVNLWSAWEYVILEYPVYWYGAGTTPLQMEDVANVNHQYNCHDGLISMDYVNSLFPIDSIVANGFGQGNWNGGSTFWDGAGVVEFNNSVSYMGNEYESQNNIPVQWLGTKYQSDTLYETIELFRQNVPYYDSSDYCICSSRNFILESVKNPEIISVTVPGDTVNVQDQIVLDATVDWSGISHWYIDSNLMNPPYVGNSQIIFASGPEGWHSVYNVALDSYGCFDDTLVSQAFYIRNYSVDSMDVDTLIYTPSDDNDEVGIDADFGGNLIITPNGDGLNDHINLLNLGTRDYEFTLYNRWGQVIKKFKNEGSIITVESLESSTYYYRLILDNNEVAGFIELKK